MTVNNSSLLIIAEEQSAIMWRIVGATGIIFKEKALPEILKQLQETYAQYRCALIGENVYKHGYPILRFLTEKEIPWIMLLDTSTDEKAGYKELETLSEKAIGMKLQFN